ncbi:uncharacterized protein [Venturia canescens]|uniref:uncharacterized protein isoform X2 n=1 Tax=Venturia canescens TaxID=32260 RepID=UPI001C9C42EF|nr:uncharacterized protein LOC122408921 isoform X2 [Venturia canescens]
MGNYTSKLFSHNEHDRITKSNQTSPSSIRNIRMWTPPVTKRKFASDPRSATMGIIRTPIEVTSQTPPGRNQRVASALPKYLQGKCYLETDFDTVMPVTTPEKSIADPRSPNVDQQRTPIVVKSTDNYVSPVVKVHEAPEMETPVGVRTILSTFDPRSPAMDFDRTPILKTRSTEYAETNTLTDSMLTLTEIKNGNNTLSYCETTTANNIPEIQTISETVLVCDESLSLENRFEVGEVLKDSFSKRGSSEEMSDCSENEEQITVIRNPKILSAYPNPPSTWTENEAFETEDNLNDEGEQFDQSSYKTLDHSISEIIKAVIQDTTDEPKASANNDKIKVWRDSISPNVNEETKNVVTKTTTEEIIIEFDDETVAKNSKPVNTVVKITSKIDDDKSSNQTKKKWKIFNEAKHNVETSLNRTPLGNRSNNHKERSRLPAKSPQQLLRNKGLSTISIQQENTPPTGRFISKTKPNGIQWDPDSTL